MAKALYRTYRSTSLDTLVGQSHVTEVLKRAIAQDKVGHAYLLSGPRGVGKTSIARILAHEIIKAPYDDEQLPLDIIEIDAASNNGVDDVRDLRDKVRLAPSKAARKVYIIDEVHMLSKSAFNALLKTLEEPPEHVVFILATTNPEKLPDTIVSRTQHFRFRPISVADITAHLRTIATSEAIAIDDKALQLVAERGRGSFRDSISLLEQLTTITDTQNTITKTMIEETLGIAPQQLIDDLSQAALQHHVSTIVELTDTARHQGIETIVLIDQLIDALRERIADEPAVIELISAVLTARESSRPDIALVTALVRFRQPVTPVVVPPVVRKTAAATATSLPTITAPVAPATPKAAPKAAPDPTPAKAPVETTPPDTVAEPPVSYTSADRPPFDWNTLVSHVQQHHVALYSVLSKCTPEVDGDTLRLYTGRKFNKTKLDEPKQRATLTASLRESGLGDYEIDTVPTAPPPRDPAAAAVAAMMGGGEEVNAEI